MGAHSKKNILIVEDDLKLNNGIRLALKVRSMTASSVTVSLPGEKQSKKRIYI